MRNSSIASLLALVAFVAMTSWAGADWRGDIGVFRVGLVTADQSSDSLERFEPFRVSLSEALDMDVEFFRARSPKALIDALSADRVEYAVFSSFAYALAWSVCECVEPLVSPRAIDSTDGYHLILMARPGGPSSVSDLSGKTIGMLSGEGTAENLLFKGALGSGGGDINAIDFVSRASGEDTLSAFLGGEFSALAGWSSMTGNPSEGYSRGTLRLIAQKGGNPSDFPVIWQSRQIPHRVHAVGKKLNGEAKNILRNLLNGLYDRNPASYDSIEPVYGGGFVTTRHSRFEPLVSVVGAIDAIEAAKQTEKLSE